jgi:hypothetical protein
MRGSPQGLPDLVQGLPGPLLLDRITNMLPTLVSVDFPLPAFCGGHVLSVPVTLRKVKQETQALILLRPLAVCLGAPWKTALKCARRYSCSPDSVNAQMPAILDWIAKLSDDGLVDPFLADHFLTHFQPAVNRALSIYGLSA